MRRSAIVLASFFAFGCGPDIRETRLGFYPPREPACNLEFVQSDPRLFAPGGPWEVLGYIEISEKHQADPFSPKYRSIVRPRACNMGGEAVTLMQAASRESRFGSGAGSTWAVLRHRQLPGAPPTSTAF